MARPIYVLSAEESWNLLSSRALGRLVTCVEGAPEIFPVNFVVQRRAVLFRTAEFATKLFTVVMDARVVFEAANHNVAEGWSVIVKGIAHVLNSSAEIEEAQRAELLPWTAGPKPRYVRIDPSEISGRRFRFASAADTDRPSRRAGRARGRCRWCQLRRGSCRRDSAAPARSAVPFRRDIAMRSARRRARSRPLARAAP